MLTQRTNRKTCPAWTFRFLRLNLWRANRPQHTTLTFIRRCLSCSAACFAHSCHRFLSATSISFSSDKSPSPLRTGTLLHKASTEESKCSGGSNQKAVVGPIPAHSSSVPSKESRLDGGTTSGDSIFGSFDICFAAFTPGPSPAWKLSLPEARRGTQSWWWAWLPVLARDVSGRE